MLTTPATMPVSVPSTQFYLKSVMEIILFLLSGNDPVEDEKYYGVSVNYLQSRLKNLEDENRTLRGEANRLAMQTDEVEAKEAQLMSDFASQLSVTRSDLSVIMDQADKHREENVTLHNNCEFLRSKLSNVEASLKIVRTIHIDLLLLIN